MMTQQALADKRRNKQLKRKNKKYTGPKYSKLEQLLLVAPLLQRAGIVLFEDNTYDASDITGESSTSFKE